MDSLVLNVAPHDMIVRASFMLACVVGGLLTSKLIKESIKGEKKLAESEHRFRCFYEGAFEGLAITVNGKIVDVNDQLLKIYGYERNELIGKEVYILVHPEDKKLVKGNIKRSYKNPYCHKGVAKDGSTLHVEVCGSSITFRGQPARVTAINDVTARKKAEAKLAKLVEEQRRTSKMEAIGNFASGIAHDFNNTLTPIIGGCEILLYDMPDECRSSCSPQIKKILAAAETASLLVHRIQAFTARDATGDVSMTGGLRLQGCLKESFDFVRSMTPSSIDMSMHIDPTIPVVRATDVTIRQILMNLCKNSAQAIGHNNGKILIKVSSDEIFVEKYGLVKGKYVKVEVEDNGRGMPPEVLERALDPYYSTKPKGEGTGIGLSVVNGIVVGYGGFVRLYSEVGVGTRVVIHLPAVEGAEEIRECKIDEPLPIGRGEKILLVDDEDMVISIVTDLIKSLNYEVTPFMSSTAALDEVRANPDKYDVLVTDLTMPEMTGVILIKEVKKITPDIRIVLCSGLGSNGKHVKEIFGDSIGAYLTKPVTRRGYAEVLAKVLEGKNE
jgi:PAS domain S-box-containing protein